MKVKIKVLNPNTRLPSYATKGSSGMDMYSTSTYHILPATTNIIHCGFYVAVPEGYELQVRPRSGLSINTKLRVANSPGTIDSDYRGEVSIIIDNIGTNVYCINKGDRIAQLILVPVLKCEWDVVEDLDSTERAGGGFGSTGK